MSILYCDVCHEKMNPSNETLTTLVGYVQFDDHIHDTNCVTKKYICSNGHKKTIAKLNKCPVEECSWSQENRTCSCHDGEKVLEWYE